MNKQKEFNLEKMGVADLVKPLNDVELMEVEGGSRENEKQASWFRSLYELVFGGATGGVVGGAAAVS